MRAVSSQPTCRPDCPCCPAGPPGGDSQTVFQQDLSVQPGQPGQPGRLAGGRFALAAAWVFGGPLAAVIAAEAALGRQIGELAALGVGLAAAVCLLVPAAWVFRRDKEGPT